MRFYTAIRLPLWIGVIVLGVLPIYLGFAVGHLLDGTFLLNFSGDVSVVPLLIVSVFAANYILKRMKETIGYAKLICVGPVSDGPITGLCSLKHVVPVWIVLSLLLGVLISLGGTPVSSYFSLALQLGVSEYAMLIASTLVWVFSYSMYSINQLGKLPMKLKTFGEDRTLGLRPFGLASFRITLVYLVAASVFVLVLVIGGIPFPYDVSLLSFLVLAIPFFVLSLRNLHRKLVNAKVQEATWITQRYASKSEAIKESRDSRLDEAVKSDFVTIRQIQQDLQQVHN